MYEQYTGGLVPWYNVVVGASVEDAWSVVDWWEGVVDESTGQVGLRWDEPGFTDRGLGLLLVEEVSGLFVSYHRHAHLPMLL